MNKRSTISVVLTLCSWIWLAPAPVEAQIYHCVDANGKKTLTDNALRYSKTMRCTPKFGSQKHIQRISRSYSPRTIFSKYSKVEKYKPIKSKRSRSYASLISRIARENKLDPDLLDAIVAVESNYDPYEVSRKGAAGLMQLMPGTAKDMGVKDPFDPVDNLRGGAKYFRLMLNTFGNIRTALAAYNAGPGNVTRYKGIPPFPETKRYIMKVMSHYRN